MLVKCMNSIIMHIPRSNNQMGNFLLKSNSDLMLMHSLGLVFLSSHACRSLCLLFVFLCAKLQMLIVPCAVPRRCLCVLRSSSCGLPTFLDSPHPTTIIRTDQEINACTIILIVCSFQIETELF